MSQPSPSLVDRHIGARIRLRRTLVGLSQGGLGERLGVSPQQMRHYEDGLARIGSERLPAIAHELGVSVSFFFEEHDMSDEPANRRTAVYALLRNHEEAELADAFSRIGSPALRRALLDLAKAAARPQGSAPESRHLGWGRPDAADLG